MDYRPHVAQLRAALAYQKRMVDFWKARALAAEAVVDELVKERDATEKLEHVEQMNRRFKLRKKRR